MSQGNVEIVRAAYEEWAKGNLRVGGELYDADLLFIPRRHIPEARRYLGPEGLREFMLDWLESMGDVTLVGEEFVDAGSSVVVSVVHRGVGKDSGAAAEMRYAEVWTFRGAKVIRREQFESRDEALEAVGLSE